MPRTKILILAFVSITFVPFKLVAQNSVSTQGTQVEYRVRDNGKIAETTIGSPYVDEEFKAAKVNEDEKIYYVRYDASKDLIEFKHQNGTVLVLDEKKDYAIKILDSSNKMYKSVTFEDGQRGYAIVFFSSESGYSIYRKEVISFARAQVASSSYGTDKPASFTREDDIYLFQEKMDGKLQEIPTKKKGFYSLFGGKSFMKEMEKKGLSYKSPTDMVKIIDAYYKANK